MNNPPKNDTPDKALVDAIELRLNTLLRDWTQDQRRDAANWLAKGSPFAALSQPQHGGLVEAFRCGFREARYLLDPSVAKAEGTPEEDDAVRMFVRVNRDLSNSPVVGEDTQAIKYEGPAVDAVQSLLERGRAHIDADGYLVLAKPTPTDTGNRREAVRGLVAGAGETHEGIERATDDILALIAGPPEGIDEARKAWEGVLAGMKRFGMESEAIETIDDYFARPGEGA